MLRPELIGAIPEETARVAWAAFRKGSFAMQLRDELGTLYTDADFAAALARLRRCGVAPRIGGSGAMGMADVAAGRIDAYGELDINLWDCAAAIVICVEAGAHVSPFMQGHGPERGGPILACAPALANKLSWLTED